MCYKSILNNKYKLQNIMTKLIYFKNVKLVFESVFSKILTDEKYKI